MNTCASCKYFFKEEQRWTTSYPKIRHWTTGWLFKKHHSLEVSVIKHHFAYRGKIEMYPRRRAIPTVFSGKSERHSAKPDEFYHMVEPLGVNRLDIFARRQREGWTCWGNEVRGSCDECEKADNCAKTKAEDCQWLIQANSAISATQGKGK